MLDKIIDFSEKHNMFPRGSIVMCGLSGGADSVCLTVCLKMLSERLGIGVEAIHVNHCIRGEESDRDEQFCRELCRKLGIKLSVFTCDVPAYAKEHALSLEDAARTLRYDAFRQCSEGKLIATAHNANDNLETAIFNLARGSGLKGIAGIPPVRDNIVRPLLAVTRAEIENFLSEHGFDYVTDSTNLSDDYTRNKIRHKIIPLLEELNPSVVNTSVSSLHVLRDESSFIEIEVQNALAECRDGNKLNNLRAYPSLIRRRCIAALLGDNAVPYSHDRLRSCEMIAVNGGKINVQKDLYAVSDGKIFELKKICSQASEKELSEELIIGENSIFEGKTLCAELISSKNININEIVNTKLAIYYLDYDKIIGKAFVRNRRNGDRIRLYGRDFTSSVKKLINEKVPSEHRCELHFIQDELGTIFVEYIGIADRAAPNEHTKNLLKITIKHKT